MCIGAFIGVLGPEAVRSDASGALGWSAIVTVQAVGFLLGGAVALTVRPRRPLAVAVVLAGTLAAPMILLGQGAPLILVAVAAFGYAVCADFYGTLWDSTLQRHVPKHVLSRVASYDMLGSFVAAPVGLAAAGFLADRYSAAAVLVAGGILCTATVPISLLSPSVQNLHATAETEKEPVSVHGG